MPTSRYDLEILIRTRKEGQGIEQTNKQIDSFGKQLSGILKTITAGTAVIAGAGIVIKETFDLGKEGAQLQLIEEQYGRLADSIGADSDEMLAQIEEATRGTVASSDIMAQAGQIMSLQLADNQEDVVRLSNVVSQLGLDMSQVILTFANDSKMRLDALGLSVTDVEERTQKYIDQGHEMSKAFDLAVLEALEARLQLVGSAAENPIGAYQRLEANVKNATNALKEHLAEGLLPVVEYLNGDYAQAMLNADKAAVEAAVATDDFTKAKEASVDADNAIIAAAAQTSDTFDEFVQKLTDARVHMFDENITRQWYEQEKAIQANAEAIASAFDLETDAGRQAMQQQQQLIDQRNEYRAVVMAGQDEDKQYFLEQAVVREQYWLAEQARLEEYRAIFGRLNEYISATEAPISSLVEAQMALNEASGEWVQVTRDNSSEISDISEQLALDLTDDQENAYKDILNTVDKGSAEWLTAYNALQDDLSESQANALIAQRAELEAASGEIMSVYTGNAQDAEEAQKRIDEANAAISLSYRQMASDIVLASISQTYGDNALAAQKAALETQVALGLITQEQADAQLEVAENMEQVRLASETLTEQFLADGILTEQEGEKIAAAVGLIEQGFQGSNEALMILVNAGVTNLSQLEGSTGNATAAVRELKDESQEFSENSPYTGEYELEVTGREALRELIGLLDSVDGRHARGTAEVATSTVEEPGGKGSNPAGKVPKEPEFDFGGYTGSTGGRVHANEFVMNPGAVNRWGLETLQQMNQGQGPVTENYIFNIQNGTQLQMASELVRDKRKQSRRLSAFRKS